MGIAAGYFGGRVDTVVSFLVTTRLSLPVVMVALAVVAIAGGSLQVVVLVLGLLLWDRFAVVMRSATMQLRNLEYVAAARSVGCSTPRILIGEILPNLVSALVVVASYEMAQAILLEAALSFLGLGVQPPLPSWGLMVAEAKEFMLFEPWMILMPGLAICILVLAINMLGDGIRDATAPEGRS
jgi:peptide/nickel transport system permease protein